MSKLIIRESRRMFVGMEALKKQVIQELGEARKDLLGIAKSELSHGHYGSIGAWYKKWLPTLRRADSIGCDFTVNIPYFLQGHESNTDVEALSDLRLRTITYLDDQMTKIDNQISVRSILEELILKVKDLKLATLLKEFNAAKESMPNLAAVGFRTILPLIIKERAIQVKSACQLAIKDDLGFEPDIKAAIHEQIFSSAENKLLSRYLTGGKKDTFDNVAHKPGDNTLVDKDDLNDAVALLNSLLPTILD